MNGRRRPPEPSARALALDILDRVERRGAFASVLLDRRESRIRDPRDAALLHDIVLGVLRWRLVLDAVLSRVAKRPSAAMDPEVRQVLRLGVYGLLFHDRVPAFATVDTAVELVKRSGRRAAAGFVNGVLRSVAREGRGLLPPEPAPGDVAALSLARSHPRWWVERLVGREGWDGAERVLRADNLPAPTVLRPNLERTTPRELQARLDAEGIRTTPGVLVPEALRVVAGRAQHARAVREGFAWIQDEGSQLVPLLFGRVLRPRVADVCAAPGGKTVQLAEALPGGGLLVAVDRRPSRIRRVVDNARRLGRTGIAPLVADMGTGRPPLRASFDHVLVDAPCSGTGTLRRHPEIRWRLTPGDLERLSAAQDAILRTVADLVAPGGSLVYAVCSLEPEEGERRVAALLGDCPRFRRADPSPQLPAPARRTVGSDGAVRTSPALGTDGFFAALLVRRP